MIIGNGQLANYFQNFSEDNICIFASGVSNSNCIDDREFKREESLLIKTLKNSRDKKFVYFSSCALSAKGYLQNEYYLHKEDMESIIKRYSNEYYIFRLPQLFGELKEHKTLINFIYYSIVNSNKFNLYDKAYRYVIEISDVKILVESYLKFSNSCIVIDLANPYRYKVLDIVKTFEKLLNRRAIYEVIDKRDSYRLDLSIMNEFIYRNNLKIKFGKNYLENKLQNRLWSKDE